jgi:ribosome-associated toxin RatA of RatAB toxin-antitoxin module
MMALAGTAHAADDDWRFVGSRDGVVVDRRRVPGSSIDELRATTVVRFSPKQVFDVLWKHDEYVQFVPYLMSLQILRDDGKERLIYERVRVPLVKNRDYTVRVIRTDEPLTGSYHLQFAASPDGPAPNADFVRIERLWGGWSVTPSGDGGARVVYVVASDPAGTIPSWIANSAQKDATTRFVLAMMKRVEERTRRP